MDFGEEQLTQPHMDDISGPEGLTRLELLELMHELGWRIGEIRPARYPPITVFLGGDAAAVFNGTRHRSANGLCVFATDPLETILISRVASSLEADNELRIYLTERTLQDRMDAEPQIVQKLVADAASIEPIYSCPVLKVVVPRWEIPYAIKMHQLAFGNNGDRELRGLTQFLLYYLLATATEPSQLYYLRESSVQEHVRALHPEETRYVPRSVFDKVNRECKERLKTEPILFEG